MRPYAQVERRYSEHYKSAAGHISKSHLRRIYVAVRDALPTLEMHAVARVRGPIIDTHIRGTIGGAKFEWKDQRSDKATRQTSSVAGCIVQALADHRGIDRPDTTWIAEAIVPEVDKLLEQALLQVKNLDKAVTRAKENKILVDQARHNEAMKNLDSVLSLWPYTREEVLAAWDLVQVKKVMES